MEGRAGLVASITALIASYYPAAATKHTEQPATLARAWIPDTDIDPLRPSARAMWAAGSVGRAATGTSSTDRLLIFLLVLWLLGVGQRRGRTAADAQSPDTASGASACVEYANPNSDAVPMVSPPREVRGLKWDGSNCGIDDPEPQVAQLEMHENGTNVWIFDGQRQTGDQYEAVVGWHCIDVGRGYWWGMVPYSNVTWYVRYRNNVVTEYWSSTTRAVLLDWFS